METARIVRVRKDLACMGSVKTFSLSIVRSKKDRLIAFEEDNSGTAQHYRVENGRAGRRASLNPPVPATPVDIDAFRWLAGIEMEILRDDTLSKSSNISAPTAQSSPVNCRNHDSIASYTAKQDISRSGGQKTCGKSPTRREYYAFL